MYEFEGKIKESVNNAPVSGAEVTLYQRLYQGGVTQANFSKIAAISTDGLGHYQHSFEREQSTEFKITVKKDGYFDQEEIMQSSVISTENSNVFDYTLEPVSWVTFDIYNLNPETWDQLTLVLHNFRDGCSGCSPQDYYYFYEELDTQITFKTTGGEWAKFLYKDEWSGQTTQDSVYTTPFDTITYSFSY